jgi:ribosomal-protein-alanine N-acetyltransferase
MITHAHLPVTIEPMTEDDLAAVSEIERQSFPTVWRTDAYLKELRNPTSHYRVARWEGRVIGFAGMWMSHEEAHIATLAVEPTYRRRGVARRLMFTLLREAVRRGAASVTLEVREGNEAAQRLYESLGFETVARIGHYYLDTGEDALVMWVHGVDKPAYRAKLTQAEEKLSSG